MDLHEYLSQSEIQPSELARRLGVSSAVVYQWRTKRRPIPLEYCAALEIETQGAISRRELRPDDWQRIWPELAEQEADHG